MVLRLRGHGGGLAAEEVLLGGTRTRRLRGRQTGGPAVQVGTHLAKERRGRGSGRRQLIGWSLSTVLTRLEQRTSIRRGSQMTFKRVLHVRVRREDRTVEMSGRESLKGAPETLLS